jgi:hypothetical protein
MRDLEYYGEQMIKELEAIGLYNDIPLTFRASGRMTRAWGNCHTWWKTTNGVRNYTRAEITIDKFLLEEDSPEWLLRCTLLHEGCHLIDKNKHGHRAEWLKLADLVGDCYGFDITQYVNKKERNAIKGCKSYQTVQKKRADSKDRWNFTCAKCGRVYRRAKRPTWLTNWGYNPLDNSVVGATCGGKCHGKLIITRAPKSSLNDVKRIY